MKRRISIFLAIFLIFQIIAPYSKANSRDLNIILKENAFILEANDKVSIKEIEIAQEKKDLSKEKYYSEEDSAIFLEKGQKLSFPNTYNKSVHYKISYLKNGEVNLLTDHVSLKDNLVIENLNQQKLDILKPGESGTISFEIKNNQKEEIRNITVHYIENDSFEFLGTNKTEKFNSLNSMGKETVQYNLTVKSSVKNNMVDLPILLSYQLGNIFLEEKLMIKIPIENSQGTQNQNLGDKDFLNDKNPIEQDNFPAMDSLGGQGVFIPDSTSNFPPDIIGGGSQDVVQVSGSQDVKNKPKLIVDNYNFTPRPLKAGENFDLTISFFNTNAKKRINNIRIVLNSEAGSPATPEEGKLAQQASHTASVFTPVDSSNTFYIDSIQPKTRVEKKVTLTTPRDLKPQTYELQIALDYEDKDGNEFTTTEVVGIPIIQDTNVKLGEIETPLDLEVGMSDSVNIDFYNTGRSPIYNLMISLEGNFEAMSSTEFIGTFQPGSSDQYSVMITPTEEGEQKGTIVFNYEDVNGDNHEIREDFTVVTHNMNPDMEDGFEEEKPFYKSFLFYGLLLILVLVILYIIYYRKKKSSDKQYNESLDLDE